jgi:hypothetical protein
MLASVFYGCSAGGVDANLRNVPLERFSMLGPVATSNSVSVSRGMDGKTVTGDDTHSQYDDLEIAPHGRSPFLSAAAEAGLQEIAQDGPLAIVEDLMDLAQGAGPSGAQHLGGPIDARRRST